MKRFSLSYNESAMERDPEGDWVRWSDVQDLMRVTPYMVMAAENAFQDYVDALPNRGRHYGGRVDVATKFKVRYQAMLKFTMGEVE